MIGDCVSDVAVGNDAGCKVIKIEEGGLLESVRGIIEI